MATVMLTTIDNPFDPFDQFDSWYMFDCERGYDSCGLLDNYAKTSDSFSDKENEEEIERAIDEIIKDDPINKYMKIKR